MHGDFIWYELMTPDPAGSRDFYRNVVGWTIGEAQGDPGYAMIETSEGSVGGMLTLSKAMCDGGAKPVWLGYVGVDDVDQAVTSIEHGGGKVMMPAWDIPQGRIAMVADPDGNAFYMMKPSPPADDPDKVSNAFASEHPIDGHVAWNELWTADPAGAVKFYGQRFGWVLENEMKMPSGSYYMLRHGSLIGGMAAPMPGQPAGWTYYFRVPSIPAAVDKVKAGGGTIVMGPHEIPGGDHIIIGIDPQGATFALVGNKE